MYMVSMLAGSHHDKTLTGGRLANRQKLEYMNTGLSTYVVIIDNYACYVWRGSCLSVRAAMNLTTRGGRNGMSEMQGHDAAGAML